MNNPFEVIEARLNGIEDLILDLKHQSKQTEAKQETDQLLTVEEASEFLHLTKATIYSKHSRGEIPGVCKQGKRLYFSKERLINWIKSGNQKTTAEIDNEADINLSKGKK